MNKRSYLVLLGLIALLLTTLSIPIHAIYTPAYTHLADYLHEMGLFEGRGDSYALDAVATREEAATMLVRLIGKEEEALTAQYTHPFTDVSEWANPYVGYLYQKAIAKGVDGTNFNAKSIITDEEYMTFMLRAIGYNDQDFKWSESILKAYQMGILNDEYYQKYRYDVRFLRDDMVLFSYLILDTDVKGKGYSLLKYLLDQETVPMTALLDYSLAPYTGERSTYNLYSEAETRKAIIAGILGYESEIVLDNTGSKIMTIDTKALMNEIQGVPGISSLVDNIKVSLNSKQVTVTIGYRLTKDQYLNSIKVAQDFVTKYINPQMSDYDKELRIHDYIIDSSKYYVGTIDKSDVFTMYGALVKKLAVCQGYSEAFHYLTTLSGIESDLVVGTVDGVGHAWNIVELDGQTYQVDVTWDDPITADGTSVKSYNYFNVTDNVLMGSHVWIRGNYPACTATGYNYYVYNNLVVVNVAQLTQALQYGFSTKVTDMLYKIENVSLTSQEVKGILASLDGYEGCHFNLDENGLLKISNIIY